MLVSIVIPSYNHIKYIQDAIESVLAQTHEELELIVVDDGSRDDSVAYLETVEDQRFSYVVQSNHGAHHAINRGLSLCKGEFLSILNSDDVYEPNRLQEALKIFAQRPKVEFLSSWLTVINQEGDELGVKKAWMNMLPWPVKDTFQILPNHFGEYTLNALLTNFVSTTSNMIFTRKVYDSIGGMRNLRFAHDWDFLLRVCERFECCNLEKPLLKYRNHESNTIKDNRQWMLFEVCWVLAANIDRFCKEIFTDSSTDYTVKLFDDVIDLFNFQGNDAIFWLLYFYFTNLKQKKHPNPEEILLENIELRESLIKKIVV